MRRIFSGLISLALFLIICQSSAVWQKIEGSEVPNYYICGAQANSQILMVKQPQSCYVYCWRSGWRRKKKCATRCNPVPDKLEWTRTDGIRFTYCHFQNWNDQRQLAVNGTFPAWSQMQMCPENQYMYGYQLKTSGNNGLGGLAIYCRNMYNQRQNQHIIVYDKTSDPWGPQILTPDYAHSFQTSGNGYIENLLFQFGAKPMIFAFEINYVIPKDFKPVPEVINQAVIKNSASFPISQEVIFGTGKTITNTYSTTDQKLQGVVFTQSNTQSQTLSTRIGVPFLKRSSSSTETFTVSTAQKTEDLSSITFGKVESKTISQGYKNNISIPACTQLIVKQTIYSVEMDIPFTARIGYTNGVNMAYETVYGKYRGVVVGNIEVSMSDSKIC